MSITSANVSIPAAARAFRCGGEGPSIHTHTHTQHPSASVSIRQHMSAHATYLRARIRGAVGAQHPPRGLGYGIGCVPTSHIRHSAFECSRMSAYVSIRQHTQQWRTESSQCSCGVHFISIRQHTSAYVIIRSRGGQSRPSAPVTFILSAYVSIRQHTVSVRSAYLRRRSGVDFDAVQRLAKVR